jgi:hypothetical protein
VEKQLNIAQCNDLEKVLYASGQLQGAAQTWWESYQAAHPNNAPPVTWNDFVRDFKAHHIPDGVIELKKRSSAISEWVQCLLPNTMIGLRNYLTMLLMRLGMMQTNNVFTMISDCSYLATPAPTSRLL